MVASAKIRETKKSSPTLSQKSSQYRRRYTEYRKEKDIAPWVKKRYWRTLYKVGDFYRGGGLYFGLIPVLSTVAPKVQVFLASSKHAELRALAPDVPYYTATANAFLALRGAGKSGKSHILEGERKTYHGLDDPKILKEIEFKTIQDYIRDVREGRTPNIKHYMTIWADMHTKRRRLEHKNKDRWIISTHEKEDFSERAAKMMVLKALENKKIAEGVRTKLNHHDLRGLPLMQLELKLRLDSIEGKVEQSKLRISDLRNMEFTVNSDYKRKSLKKKIEAEREKLRGLNELTQDVQLDKKGVSEYASGIRGDIAREIDPHLLSYAPKDSVEAEKLAGLSAAVYMMRKGKKGKYW